jgi:hypothetical protein
MASTLNAVTTGPGGILFTGDTTGAMALQTLNGNTAVYVDTSQNVGIGTTSPAGRLHVSTTSADAEVRCATTTANYATFRLKNSTNDYSMQIRTDQGNSWVLRDETAGVNRLLVDTNGNLLVGVTSPSGGFNTIAHAGSDWALVAKNLNTSGAVYAFKALLSYQPNNTSSYFIGCEDNGAGRMYVYSNGNVVNTNNSYGSISDRTLKENIVDASPKLDNLCKVKIRNFNLIGETTKQIGVVAQELEEVFPSMVEIDGNTDKKQVKYSVFVPMLVKAIQELKAINDQQAETIAALIARIEALEKK